MKYYQRTFVEVAVNINIDRIVVMSVGEGTVAGGEGVLGENIWLTHCFLSIHQYLMNISISSSGDWPTFGGLCTRPTPKFGGLCPTGPTPHYNRPCLMLVCYVDRLPDSVAISRRERVGQNWEARHRRRRDRDAPFSGRLGSLGERCELPQLGPERNPGWKRVLVHFEL